MMGTRSQVLLNLQVYVKKVEETEYIASSTSERKAYDSQLEATFEELSGRVKAETVALDQLRAQVGLEIVAEPSSDAVARLCQLRTIKAAYDDLTHSEAGLPFPDSPLPALLAVRNAQRLIPEIKEVISGTHQKLFHARRRMHEEEADLKDAHLIMDALNSRITRLKAEVDEKSQKTPDEVAQDMLREQETRRQLYEKETRRLVRALVKFINEHLAAMLAAEEVGGPVVGDLLDVSDEMLEAGFSHKGKAKKIQPSNTNNSMRKQQKIDEVWALCDSTELQSERQAAAKEMRSLIEELLNIAAEEGTGTYITLSRDSAASRFLIRAKVAQFHPKDARKLRLIDFGRELDD
ncbi:hypothetical protein MMC30_008672 [Trapelia coarctata]|nr:hypothetical protein [Trapelia coarctata]